MDGSGSPGLALGSPCISGDVEVAPGVVVASNVVLGAAGGSRLVVATGACLGPEVIIQAQGGTLVIEANVSLGSGVLVVGAGRIGAYTCVGSEATLINPQLPSHRVVAARSLTGDLSRSSNNPVDQRSGEGNQASEGAGYGSPSDTSPALAEAPPPVPASQNGHPSSHQNGRRPVYGRNQVDQLLTSLFPHRAPLNGSSSRDGPSAM